MMAAGIRGVPRSCVCAVLLLTAVTPVLAQEPDVPQFETGITKSQRQDNMRWSLAGPGFDPNILSELTWRRVQIDDLRWQGSVRYRRVSVVASYQQGEVRDGEGQDSDYGGNDRTREFSRSYNDTEGDLTRDLSLGAGWHFSRLEIGPWRFVPRAGISHHEQKWRMTNGRQAVSEPGNMPPDLSGPPPGVGSFSGLNSTYRARWSGRWIGGNVQVQALSRLGFNASYEYHYVGYYGYANWNLINAFEHPKSYEQRANGIGHVLSLGASYDVAFMRLLLRYDQQYWETGQGYTRFFLSHDDPVSQPLNSVQWRSHALSLGIIVPF